MYVQLNTAFNITINILLQLIRLAGYFYPPLARKFHTVAGLTKYREREKNWRARGIRGEYVRRVRRGFRRFADGNRAFSIGGFVAFIPARRHKLASRRVRDAPLFLFARERRYFQRASRRPFAVPTALYLYFSPTSIGTIPLILGLTLS